MQSVELKPDLCNPQLLVVTLVVLTEREFRFSLHISQLLAKAIPVRGAKFLFSCILTNPYLYIDSTG
ncbi:hypothetical protein MRO95_14585 [Dickeya dianthicola]|uniref:hypothetical protein n=1 Tax=Dickeya dianthicola TaxID=204039 RepID=UPI001F620555|nr:hypothetical protein [Dickeya dianthicola]MCI4205554.1 hypothetical protein [Dickeya dianthicola]MCI4212730.1 hypothetical protein [Dickeya dianthicola]